MNLRTLSAAALLAALASGCGPTNTDETAANSTAAPTQTPPSPSVAPSVAVASGPVIVVQAPSGTAAQPSPSAWPLTAAAVATTQTDASASATPAPSLAPVDITMAKATPVPAKATPPAKGTSGPVPTPTPADLVAYLPPDAQPKIVRITISSQTVHGGDTVSGSVVTSSNVASVELRIGGFSMSMAKAGVGQFQMAYKVPNLPFFLHRTYPMRIIARNTRGDETSASLPITVR